MSLFSSAYIMTVRTYWVKVKEKVKLSLCLYRSTTPWRRIWSVEV